MDKCGGQSIGEAKKRQKAHVSICLKKKESPTLVVTLQGDYAVASVGTALQTFSRTLYLEKHGIHEVTAASTALGKTAQG